MLVLYVPVGHNSHAAADVEPVRSLYVPVGHSRQVPLDVAPMLALYVPAGHAVHAAREVDAVLVLYVPCGQRVQALEPAIEYDPVGQLEQSESLVAPEAAENWPAGHKVQADNRVAAWLAP